MTDDLTIETYRYRAPTVVPLDVRGGTKFRVAVLTPGWDQPWIECNQISDLVSVLDRYIKYNQLGPEPKAPVMRKRAQAAILEEAIGKLSVDQMVDLLKDIETIKGEIK